MVQAFIFWELPEFYWHGEVVRFAVVFGMFTGALFAYDRIPMPMKEETKHERA